MNPNNANCTCTTGHRCGVCLGEDPEPLSECCGAESWLGVDSDGCGICSACREHAEFTTKQGESAND